MTDPRRGVEHADERGGQALVRRPTRETRLSRSQRLARRLLLEHEEPERVAQPAHDPGRAEVVALHVADDERDEVLVDGDDVVPVAADLDADGRRQVASGDVPAADGGDGVGQQVALQLVRDPALAVDRPGRG